MLNEFSDLIRHSFKPSHELAVTLDEELKFAKNYLKLEKQRFVKIFEYKFDIAPEVNRSLMIPKMILQIHAESAIKQGLVPKGKDGLLEIIVRNSEKGLLVSIIDNGVGRSYHSGRKRSSLGQGMIIIQQIYELFENLHGLKIEQKIIDLFDVHEMLLNVDKPDKI